MIFIKRILIIIIMLAMTVSPLSSVAKESSSDELIRFHVIANSDQLHDQELKLKVRDELISNLRPILAKAQDSQQAQLILTEKLKEIESIAENKVGAEGFSYKVKAEIGKFNFPVKAYYDFILPAGEYKALRVVIGEGAGANWWCVMFPPICFVDLSSQINTNWKAKTIDSEAYKVKSVKPVLTAAVRTDSEIKEDIQPELEAKKDVQPELETNEDISPELEAKKAVQPDIETLAKDIPDTLKAIKGPKTTLESATANQKFETASTQRKTSTLEIRFKVVEVWYNIKNNIGSWF